MLPEIIFPVIPAMYPIRIAMIKIQLFPLVDFEVMLLYTEIGHEMPKQISITLSKIDTIYTFSLSLFFAVYDLTLKK